MSESERRKKANPPFKSSFGRRKKFCGLRPPELSLWEEIKQAGLCLWGSAS